MHVIQVLIVSKLQVIYNSNNGIFILTRKNGVRTSYITIQAYMRSPDHTNHVHIYCNIYSIAILWYKHKTSTYMNIYRQSCFKVFHILITAFATVLEMIWNRWSPECHFIFVP